MTWSMKADEGGTYEQPPPGPQAAVQTRIIDIGTHTDTSPMYGEQRRRQVVFMWELAELMTDGRPFTIQSFYTLSMHEKANLRLMLEAWRGKAFEVGEEVALDVSLGKSCLLNIGETATGKSKVLSVSRLPKGMPALVSVGPLLLFRTDEPDWEVFEQLSDFHKKKIESSEEWSSMKSYHETMQQAAGNEQQNQDAQAQAATDDFDDDIPF